MLIESLKIQAVHWQNDKKKLPVKEDTCIQYTQD